MEEEVKTQELETAATQTEEGGTPDIEEDFDRFAAYEEKPDYAKGGYADEEEELEQMDFERKPEEEQPKEQQAEPFSRISFNGGDYDFASKEQLEAMAQRGLQLEQQAQRISGYSRIIDAAEKNPALGNAISQIIQQYMQTGQIVPLQTPQAQTAEDYSREPEQRDDEEYDDYEKRLAQWRENKMNHMVDERVAAALQNDRQYQMSQRVVAWSKSVTDKVKDDPDARDVLARMQNDVYCAPQLRAMADRDANMFMRVYDDIKRGMGKPPFYGAPSLVPQGQQQPSMVQAAVQQQRSAPFSERATTSAPVAKAGTQRQQQQLPDFKQMSDDDFEKFVEGLKLRSFN